MPPTEKPGSRWPANWKTQLKLTPAEKKNNSRWPQQKNPTQGDSNWRPQVKVTLTEKYNSGWLQLKTPTLSPTVITTQVDTNWNIINWGLPLLKTPIQVNLNWKPQLSTTPTANPNSRHSQLQNTTKGNPSYKHQYRVTPTDNSNWGWPQLENRLRLIPTCKRQLRVTPNESRNLRWPQL